jgi:hypothetical protein
MGALGFVAMAIWISITGLALLELCRCHTRSRATRLGLAIGAGFVVSCLVLNASLALTAELHFWPLFLVYAASSGYWLTKQAPARTAWRPRRRDLLLVVVGFAFVGLFNASGEVPFSGYDSKAIYGIKAKALLFERDVRGPLFLDPDVIHYHGDYPLGLPVLIALSAWVAEGPPSKVGVEPHGVGEWVRQFDSVDHYMPLATLWVLALMLVVAGYIRERELGLLGSVALFSLALPVVMIYPWAGGGSWSLAGADLPLALCFGGVALASMRALEGEGRRGWLVLAALFAAGAVSLKRDAMIGLALWPIVLVSCGRSNRHARWTAATCAAGLVLGTLVVGVIRARTVASIDDENFLQALASLDVAVLTERLPLLLEQSWEILWKRHMGYYWVVVMLAALPVGWRLGGGLRVLAVWLGLYLAACLVVFWVTPSHMGWHIETALPRLWCQLVVPAAFLIVEAASYLFAPASTDSCTGVVALPSR